MTDHICKYNMGLCITCNQPPLGTESYSKGITKSDGEVTGVESKKSPKPLAAVLLRVDNLDHINAVNKSMHESMTIPDQTYPDMRLPVVDLCDWDRDHTQCSACGSINIERPKHCTYCHAVGYRYLHYVNVNSEEAPPSMDELVDKGLLTTYDTLYKIERKTDES